MKKFVAKILVFAVLVAIVDVLAGMAAHYLESRANGGQPYKNYEIASLVEPDILILGSSRSTHHYDPAILKDSLGLEAYVGGQDGNGVVMMWPELQVISARHTPKIVIYDIYPPFDLQTDDMHRYLRYLRPLWGKVPAVNEAITRVDEAEGIKNLSALFRYNSSFPSLLKGAFSHEERWDHGYIPIYGTLKHKNNVNPTPPFELSELKAEFFGEMSRYCDTQGIRLIVVYSPAYRPENREKIDIIKKILDSKVEFYDFSSDARFLGNDSLFKDLDHLNDNGAKAFTKILIDIIR